MQFLKAIYEDFYQAYNPAAADRLGVVYTRATWRSRRTSSSGVADHLLQKHDWAQAWPTHNVQIQRPGHKAPVYLLITSLINYLPEDIAGVHRYRQRQSTPTR